MYTDTQIKCVCNENRELADKYATDVIDTHIQVRCMFSVKDQTMIDDNQYHIILKAYRLNNRTRLYLKVVEYDGDYDDDDGVERTSGNIMDPWRYIVVVYAIVFFTNT